MLSNVYRPTVLMNVLTKPFKPCWWSTCLQRRTCGVTTLTHVSLHTTLQDMSPLNTLHSCWCLGDEQLCQYLESLHSFRRIFQAFRQQHSPRMAAATTECTSIKLLLYTGWTLRGICIPCCSPWSSLKRVPQLKTLLISLVLRRLLPEYKTMYWFCYFVYFTWIHNLHVIFIANYRLKCEASVIRYSIWKTGRILEYIRIQKNTENNRFIRYSNIFGHNPIYHA